MVLPARDRRVGSVGRGPEQQGFGHSAARRPLCRRQIQTFAAEQGGAVGMCCQRGGRSPDRGPFPSPRMQRPSPSLVP